MVAPSRSSIANRACDGCRRRKVKCDSANPCANCRISQLPCQYTRLQKKRGPKAPRKESNPVGFVSTVDLPGAQVLHNSIPAEVSQVQASPALSDGAKELREGFDSTQLWRTPTNFGLVPVVEALPSTTCSPASARAIWDGLLVSIGAALPSMSVMDIANSCIDLYMQYTFPTAPIVHEPTLRRDASIFFSGASSATLFGAQEEDQRVAHMRAFTLVTALCASITSVMPESLLPYGYAVAGIFLRASREMLKRYEDYDLEHPNSTSLAIRELQSTALQHVTGKKGAAFQVVGQATLLALSLQLYKEDSIIRNDPVESQLLRLTFWHLYFSDKASACLGTRPCLLDESLFDGELTLHPCGEPFTSLLDTNKPWYEKPYEEHLLIGYSLITRLWSSAARLILGIRSFDKGIEDKETRITRLTQEYLHFVGIMDGLPHWLQLSSIMTSPEDGSVACFQKKSFWVQRCTLTMTFQCLRLVVLQQCIDSSRYDIMGLVGQPLTLSMKKAEIIQDFLQAMDDIPFIYHQIKGEPSVERIRRVGTILLEMVQNADSAIKARATSYFTRLLDSLAKLNSKTSEELNQ